MTTELQSVRDELEIMRLIGDLRLVMQQRVTGPCCDPGSPMTQSWTTRRRAARRAIERR